MKIIYVKAFILIKNSMKNLKSNIDYFDESSTTLEYFKDKKVKKRPIPIDL